MIELLEEMAAIVIGHAWLFGRWLIYLYFGGTRDEEDEEEDLLPNETMAQKGRGRMELCGKMWFA